MLLLEGSYILRPVNELAAELFEETSQRLLFAEPIDDTLDKKEAFVLFALNTLISPKVKFVEYALPKSESLDEKLEVAETVVAVKETLWKL